MLILILSWFPYTLSTIIFQGEILRKRREIDANWFEGTNSKGQIGIFPKCYVQSLSEEPENGEDVSSIAPDRPKTPKIVTTNNSSR